MTPSPTLVSWQGLPWLAAHPLAYPLLEALHIAGIALLVGSLAVLELRVWGAVPALPPAALGRLALRVTAAGFALVLTTGLLMFATQPGELLANRAFVVKLALLVLAALNALAFHARGGLARADRAARVQTALSAGLWLCVIIAGRWIAYA